MDVRHTLICFFFLSGNTGLITEGIPITTGKEGGTITYGCKLISPGNQEALDKENDKAEPGRCSIEFPPKPISLSLYVSITNLTKSDSGQYRCVLDIRPHGENFEVRDAGNIGLITEGIPIITVQEGGDIRHECKFTFCGSQKAFYKENKLLTETDEDKDQCDRYSIEFSTEPMMESDSDNSEYIFDRLCLIDTFELRVEDAPTTLKPNWTPGPFPTSVPSTSSSGSSTPTTAQSLTSSSGSSTPTTAQSLTSSSGSSTPSSVSPKTTQQSPQKQTTAGQDILLYVCVILVIVVVVSSTAVLIYRRKTAGKPKGPPQETESTNVTEADRVYEEIREEDGWSRSPPVKISTVYAQAKYTKPNAAEGTDDYSLVTAAQKETEDNSSKFTYSVLDLSNGAPASLNSAPPGDADNVVKPGPGVAANSDGHHDEHSSNPL